ncbi:MAG: anhydro-N-acetylmuramic acid kinase, partial [Nitrospirae bacterium]
MAQATVCVGLMCGSSLDGVDVAWLVEGRLAHFATRPMPEAVAARLAPLLAGEAAAAAALAEAEVVVGRWFVDAVRRSGSRLRPHLVAAHGVTVAHGPERGFSWQLGDPATLARGLGCTAVARFRGADTAAGGEGAPLAPL